MRKKTIGAVFRITTILISLTVMYLFIIKTSIRHPEIDFLDVGQGDSALLKLSNNKLILIDGGPDNLVLKRLGENLPYNRRKIDTIILSHFHDDHIIGLIDIVKRYQVSSIIYMKGSKSSILLETLLNTAKKKNIKVIALDNKIKIDYSQDCSLEIFNPLVLNVPIDDNNSLVTKLNCGKLSALFSGDNNYKVEAALLKTKENWTANVLKASHHGSKTANSEAFLMAVDPNLLIISVGVENRYGHPNREILDRVEIQKIEIKRTDKDGTIKVNN